MTIEQTGAPLYTEEEKRNIIKSTLDTVAEKRNIIKIGEEAIEKMGEGRSILNSLSPTLHFVALLGQESKASTKRGTGGKSEFAPTTVGVKVKSDIDISVPVIDVLKDKTVGVEAEDIGTREIKAGEVFNLNMYEAMFLLIRPEYAGMFTFEGDATGVYFTAKMPAFEAGRQKLPTPTLNLRVGAIKDHYVTIDEGSKETGYTIKPEYAEEYGALIGRKAKVSRRKENKIPTPVATAMALNELLGYKLR